MTFAPSAKSQNKVCFTAASRVEIPCHFAQVAMYTQQHVFLLNPCENIWLKQPLNRSVLAAAPVGTLDTDAILFVSLFKKVTCISNLADAARIHHLHPFSDWKQLRLLVTSLFALATLPYHADDVLRINSHALQALVHLCDAGKTLGFGKASIPEILGGPTAMPRKMVGVVRLVAGKLFRSIAASVRYGKELIRSF